MLTDGNSRWWWSSSPARRHPFTTAGTRCVRRGQRMQLLLSSGRGRTIAVLVLSGRPDRYGSGRHRSSGQRPIPRPVSRSIAPTVRARASREHGERGDAHAPPGGRQVPRHSDQEQAGGERAAGRCEQRPVGRKRLPHDPIVRAPEDRRDRRLERDGDRDLIRHRITIVRRQTICTIPRCRTTTSMGFSPRGLASAPT